MPLSYDTLHSLRVIRDKGLRIHAIKLYRTLTGCSLPAANQAIKEL